MPNPALNPAILLTPAEDSYIAYDPVGDRLHTLNPVAALIAELCDGTRSIEQIRELVGPLLPEGQSSQVDHWVQEGVAAGLLIYNGGSGAAHRELTAQELFDLAHRLEARGKAKEALICVRRVTEVAPDSSNAWSYLAELSHNTGRREEERAAYEKYIELNPEDEEIKHILVALRDDTPPPRMPDECVVQIYNGFASTFESRLRDDLGYRGPERVHELIAPLLSALPDQALALLDLGCGSGLAGVEFKPFASHMIGVDLSPEMINLARARNIYDQLDVAEITGWLSRNQDSFDLILACDCFIYFGDLRPLAISAAKHLKRDGIFAFSLERGDRYPHHLTDSGRYAHHPDHVREASSEAGLSVARLEEGFLRREYETNVMGLYVALKKEG